MCSDCEEMPEETRCDECHGDWSACYCWETEEERETRLYFEKHLDYGDEEDTKFETIEELMKWLRDEK